MRVLFDKNVPYGVRHFLADHQVETTDDHGWERISNGELIQTAETAGFEVVITADQNIVYQQNLSSRKIALVVLGFEYLANRTRACNGNHSHSGQGKTRQLCICGNARSCEPPPE